MNSLPLDEVGLDGLAQADGDVGLAHGEVEFLVVEDQVQVDRRMEVDEFVHARRQPCGAEADGGLDPEGAGRFLGGLAQPRGRSVELDQHLVGGAEQFLALLGEDQAAGVAVEKGNAEILFERADLPAHRRLAHGEALAGMGERAGLRRRVEYAQFVPVHRRPLAPPPSAAGYSAASTSVSAAVSARNRCASSAAMQP